MVNCSSVFASLLPARTSNRDGGCRKESSDVPTLESPRWATASDGMLCCACEPLPAYDLQVDGKEGYVSPSNSALKAVQSFSDVASTISQTVQEMSEELRDLSLKMWDKPEVAWQEKKTHALFVRYLQSKPEWTVTPHAHGLDTAFRAEFVHKPSGTSEESVLPTIGFQSELDALPGIGHACGHNLIAISGVAASFGLASALKKHDIAARIVLIGTPAEEAGGGKRELLKAGAYKGMDACLMVHPAPMDSVGTMLAVQQISVQYTGRPAHAGAAPWEGVNAQDAGVLAYMNISALRQQIQPTQRVHGIIQGRNWAPNVIPESCKLIYNTRAPTSFECNELTKRVENCFRAAAQATGCKVEVDIFSAYKDVANNGNLSDTFRAVCHDRYDRHVSTIAFMASTDFGDVTHTLPALHAEYAIPLKNPDTDKNHTVGFADAAKTPEAHQRTLEAAISIAVVGAKVASDSDYRRRAWQQWKKWKHEIGE